jgi:hypothetical protein
MSWKIKSVLRSDAEYGYPRRKGYEVEIETDNGSTHKSIMSNEEFMLRKFLEDQYTQAVVDAIWRLIEDYGQMKYSEGSNDASND